MARQVCRVRHYAWPSGSRRRLTIATCSSKAAPKRRNAVTRGPLTRCLCHFVSMFGKKVRRNMVKPGRYRHYKGNEYEVIGCARHSETDEELVVYRALYGDRGLWVRPRAMFMEQVLMDGELVPRFLLLQEAGDYER